MTIEDIIQSCRNVGVNKTKTGDDRLFYIDDMQNILYCFGPSAYIRKALDKKDKEKILIVEYENGPYLQIGDNVYSEKIIKKFECFQDHGIEITAMHLGEKVEIKKKKKKIKS